MGKNTTNSKAKTPAPAVPAGVGFYFDKFAAAHQNPANRTIHIIFVPLLLFGLFGLSWAIPFPYIEFLGHYNGDFNWSSFLLAFLVYFYIRLSPPLGYVVLFVMLLYFYIITQMVLWQKTGGPSIALICGLIFIVSVIALFIGYKREGKKLSFEYRYKNILIAPLFLVSLVFKRCSIKY